MKTIAKTGKLQLNKETLRSLNCEQLQAVNGATGAFCAPTLFCPTDFCTTNTGVTGQLSTPQLGCGHTILTNTGVINPQNP